MPIARKEIDRIRYARKKADVDIVVFNDWLKEHFGCKLSQLESDKVQAVIDGIATINGEVKESAPVEEKSEPVVDTVEVLTEENAMTGATHSWIADKKPAEPKRRDEHHPYVLFYFSSPWFVPRLADLVYAFTRENITAHLYFDFPVGESTMSTQEFCAIRKLKRLKKTWKHESKNEGKEDILIMDDPSVAGHDRFIAPIRIGVQPSLIKNYGATAAGIKRLTQYYTWGKQEKADLKRAGANGSLITISGSPWLSYLARLVDKGDYFDAGTAVLYPPLGHITCKGYWKGSGLIGVLTDMGCKLIIIRQNRRDPNWLPAQFRMMDYLEPLNAAYEIPRYCIAPPGIPLVEPAALKVPTLRLKTGRPVSRKILQNCAPESLPDRYINQDASNSIVFAALRFFHAERKRQVNL